MEDSDAERLGTPPPPYDSLRSAGQHLRPVTRSLLDNNYFDYREIEEYLANPWSPPSAPGKQIVIMNKSEPKWLHCHHVVFPVYWQCPACSAHNKWDVRAMLGPDQNYGPSCSCHRCGALAHRDTALLNAQKDEITKLSGHNLMSTRLDASYMRCCACHGVRFLEGPDRGNGCAHCADPQRSRCPDCVLCNRFLEPLQYCNCDPVKHGVLDLCRRALGNDQRVNEARWPSNFVVDDSDGDPRLNDIGDSLNVKYDKRFNLTEPRWFGRIRFRRPGPETNIKYRLSWSWRPVLQDERLDLEVWWNLESGPGSNTHLRTSR
ncbi:uncharacterized protein THITE_156856 [Thermothielavioides terrestris NRRL 8126]|uniref:Uncharacterized protein n=1 Tax=Thermothielavioides terrestris (strain ATCC 38088 / NRRL 8126) TaxID=578455 RepID=G2RCE7_THETT|nr:uncharacterized protein THITE_156856 [Thermothielavioides terrestris NRRL 8126]AEO70582.1 hypothetical protein THITE_156856 [Thermothielavioides terrestris NRRL 8126]